MKLKRIIKLYSDETLHLFYECNLFDINTKNKKIILMYKIKKKNLKYLNQKRTYFKLFQLVADIEPPDFEYILLRRWNRANSEQ